jgi:hypothetical protein
MSSTQRRHHFNIIVICWHSCLDRCTLPFPLALPPTTWRRLSSPVISSQPTNDQPWHNNNSNNNKSPSNLSNLNRSRCRFPRINRCNRSSLVVNMAQVSKRCTGIHQRRPSCCNIPFRSNWVRSILVLDRDQEVVSGRFHLIN